VWAATTEMGPNDVSGIIWAIYCVFYILTNSFLLLLYLGSVNKGRVLFILTNILYSI
jgi:hypothetical protein